MPSFTTSLAFLIFLAIPLAVRGDCPDSGCGCPDPARVPVMSNATTFKCAVGWSGEGAPEPSMACNNCLYSGGYFHHYDFHDGEREGSTMYNVSKVPILANVIFG